MCLGDCNAERPEPSHDLADVTDAYLGGNGRGYPVEVYAAILRAAARAVDEAPTPGSLSAYNRALSTLAHAQGRTHVITS